MLLPGCASHYTKPESAFEITEKEKSYAVTVPESKLLLIIPKGDLKRKPSPIIGNYQNFTFEDKNTSFFVSGWFEPSRDFSGIKKNWESNIIRWKETKLPEPEYASFGKEGDWDFVTYVLERDNCIQSNMIAHLVKDNTWIELHLSFYCFASPGDRDHLISFLKTINVIKKN